MILKNGKRIDGCTDTLPIGTVQPFLGLTPPLGYLVCQGQLISKVEYPELYKICGSTFGAETSTHFYLPDLRGKTIAGYDSNNASMNSIGKILGEEKHNHLTPLSWYTNDDKYYLGATNFYGAKKVDYGDLYGNEVTVRGSYPSTSTNRLNYYTDYQSNYQPTITMNWIVKAAMLIPEYFIVENTLASTNTSNALSAAQGKILNDTKLSLSGGKMTGTLVAPWVNLINAGNEFNFTGSGYNRNTIWFNHAGTDGQPTQTPIQAYSFGNGQGSTAGVKLTAEYFEGTATKALADANGNEFSKSYIPVSVPVCVGSQILYNGLSGVGAKDKTALIGTYDRMLIEDLMREITIPSGYHAEYRLTAQGTSGGATYVHIYLNDLDLLTVGTWSGNTFRTIRSSELFKSTDIALEPTYQYAQNGVNLYYSVEATSNEAWEVWNITLHAYIVKD